MQYLYCLLSLLDFHVVMPIQILIADDHYIVTEGLTTLIEKILPTAQIKSFARLDDAINYLKQTTIHLIICDINMPGGNHFGIVSKIKAIQPQAKLLMLSAYSPKLYGSKYIEEGADAYLSKNDTSVQIENVILGLLSGSSNYPETAAAIPQEANPLERLSKRELEVAQLLTKGLGILEISNLLSLHMNTISTYKTRIYEKTGILSIPELVELFYNYTD